MEHDELVYVYKQIATIKDNGKPSKNSRVLLKVPITNTQNAE